MAPITSERRCHQREDLQGVPVQLVDAQGERVVQRVQRHARIQRSRPPADQAEHEAEEAERDQVLRRSRARVDEPEEDAGDDRREPGADLALPTRTPHPAQRAEDEAAKEELLARSARPRRRTRRRAMSAAVLLLDPELAGQLVGAVRA